MIKYYDTLTAYEADVKSNFESQVSLIGADNTVKYDGRNVVIDIRSARTGTIAVLDGTHALRFISVDTFSSESFMSNFEIVGVVVIGVDHPSFRGQIAIMYKSPELREMSGLCQFRLTGYICDGTDRTGTLSIIETPTSYTTQDHIISYNANNESELVNQLNAYFRTNDMFNNQKWVAVLNSDNTIDLQFPFHIAQSATFNKGKDGFALTYNTFSALKTLTGMLTKNGNRSQNTVIANLAKALAYFRVDISNTNYNPSTDVTTIKLKRPVCLPAYLGTSKYQSDHCAYLRSIYGEGEDGWLKFMESFLPLRPNNTSYEDPHKNTYYLAPRKYVDIDGNTWPTSPAADFVANIGFDHELLKKGRWVLPSGDLLFDIIGGIKYPTINDRNADVINRALFAIGAPALSNNTDIWTCSYSGGASFWSYRVPMGIIQHSVTYFGFMTLPLALLDVPSNVKPSDGTLLSSNLKAFKL